MNSSLAKAHQSEQGNQATNCEMLTLLLVPLPCGSRSSHWHLDLEALLPKPAAVYRSSASAIDAVLVSGDNVVTS